MARNPDEKMDLGDFMMGTEVLYQAPILVATPQRTDWELAEDFWRQFANSFLPVGNYCGDRDVRHRRYMAAGPTRGAVKVEGRPLNQTVSARRGGL